MSLLISFSLFFLNFLPVPLCRLDLVMSSLISVKLTSRLVVTFLFFILFFNRYRCKAVLSVKDA